VSATIRANDGPVVGIDHHLDGRIQHRVDALSVWMRPNGPADDQAIEAVDDGREVHLAGRDLELGDVGEPLLVRRCGVEVAIDEILGRWTDPSRIGAIPTPRWLGDDQALLFHQPLDNTIFSEMVTHCFVSEACGLRYPSGRMVALTRLTSLMYSSTAQILSSTNT
jgi:hypothetical protein